ncbi:MAG: hypothetical protein IT158_06675 [Bryobacterales bacterium]|nr:hypothetical protein [Bryobacterales bacterium]
MSTPREPAVRDVSLLIPGARQTASGREDIAIRLVECSGEVYVAVHTPDRETAAALRGDLSQLAARFEEQGYQAETWHPAGTHDETRAAHRAPRDESSRQPADWNQESRQHTPSQGQRRRQPGQPAWLQMLAAQQKGEEA